MQTEPEQPYFRKLWRDLQDECQREGHGAAVELLQRAFEERERKLREALQEISELHGEINPSNYDHDDASELNRQFCYALTVADEALKETPDAQ